MRMEGKSRTSRDTHVMGSWSYVRDVLHGEYVQAIRVFDKARAARPRDCRCQSGDAVLDL
jgi:hypothetical protein